MEEKEIWREVKGFESFYEVSSNGRVRSIDRYVNHYKGGVSLRIGVVLTQRLNGRGYLGVILKKNGLPKSKVTHRLIAESFIDNKKNKPYINHINGVKTDNRICNLEWCTGSENTNHAYRTGLIEVVSGSKRYNSKLTESEVLDMRLNKGSLNYNELSVKYGVSRHLVSGIINRRNWKHI